MNSTTFIAIPSNLSLVPIAPKNLYLRDEWDVFDETHVRLLQSFSRAHQVCFTNDPRRFDPRRLVIAEEKTKRGVRFLPEHVVRIASRRYRRRFLRNA
ncbi:hypothetical protein [Xanthomonas arboricola]|uniref:hypothetical protein n=1 Tax=Xanthomonas arboricola TaxID=56448 RepID=UPI0011875240|nr:hypothetical protein [Xanthomonas arboricola]